MVALDVVNKNLNKFEGKLEDQISRVNGISSNIKNLGDEILTLEKVNQFFQEFILSQTHETKLFIESVINSGMAFVFGEDVYEMKIEEKAVGTKIERYINIINKIDDIEGQQESHGGGVLAVMSFLLKFVMSYKSNKFPMMVLDETFSFVSVQYQERLSEFLKSLCEKFNYSFVLVSHQDKLNVNSDVIYEINKVGNKSVVKKIK